MIYEFECEDCGEIQERLTFNRKEIKISCIKCGGTARKIISAGSFRREKEWRK